MSNSFDFWAEGGIGARRKRGIGEEEGQAGRGRATDSGTSRPQRARGGRRKRNEPPLLRRCDKIGHEEREEGRSGGDGQKGA